MQQLGSYQVLSQRMHVALVEGDHPLRNKAETFVQQAYHRHFNANVRHLPHTLLALVEAPSRICCIAGLRSHEEGFISQHYLDVPLDRLIHDISGSPVRSDEIVEISGLASSKPRYTLHFISIIMQFCAAQGYRWSVFTITRRLSLLLQRMRLPFLELARAEAARMPEAERWGAYYQADPRVCLIRREQAISFLNGWHALPPAAQGMGGQA